MPDDTEQIITTLSEENEEINFHIQGSVDDTEDVEEEYQILNLQPQVMHIKPVKTNKARLQLSANIKSASTSQTVDGTQVFRIKRLFNEPKPLKVCEICGNKYKYQHALDSHMRRHRNEKPFECE